MWVTHDDRSESSCPHPVSFEERIEELLAKKKRLEQSLPKLVKRCHIHVRKDTEEKIAHIQDAIERAKKENQDELEPADEGDETRPSKRAKVSCEIKPICVNTTRHGNINTVYMTRSDNCAVCGDPMLMIMGEAVLSCPSCGRTKDYLDATSASTAYGEEVEFSSFSYKRSNHFQEWLNSFQAKETTEIPQEIFEKVMAELYRQRVSNPEQITTKKVREVLKDLKLRKYYEHVTQITCRLNGKRPPRMTPEQEEQCRLMFMAIQGPFEKHCPVDRKNFLSYSYCLYKFCELMAYDEFLPCFALLKGRDKLFKQDTIFKKICEELKWEFLPSI